MSTPELRTSPVWLSARMWTRLQKRAAANDRTDWQEVESLLHGAESLEGDAMTEDIRCKVSAIKRGVRLATSEDGPSI